MNKSTLKLALATILAAGAGTANAALSSDASLSITQGTVGGTSQPPAGTGSWFSMKALDLDFDQIPETSVYVPIGGFNGLNLGTTQLASGSHGGPVDGTELPDIDNPWGFFGNTGMHQTTSNTTVLSAAGNNATVDFSGWNVTWNGIASIPMGAGSWGTNANGVADVSCNGGDGNCGVGSNYTLDYTATVPPGDPSGFGNVQYGLHLEGSVVPVPAAVWLFGSGLLGLVGVARRRKAA